MWGQANLDSLSADNIGIIPTRVGTSFFSCFFSDIAQDHPHACGDKSLTSSQRQSLPGSSPRVWGQEPPIIRLTLKAGIIPTRVGTSYRNHITDAIGQDHPHACGDKIKHGEMQELFAG